MTKFTTVLLAAASAVPALAFPSPFPSYTLSPRQDSNNCTQYCSIAAGCACTIIPSDCTAKYTVQPDDTCVSIAESFGNFTVTQLYKWNPSMGRSCFGLQAYVPVCINTPWYTFTPPVQPAAGTHYTPDQTPVPLMPNTISTCSDYELVGAGTRVDQLTAENGITQEQFEAWNGNATGAWADYWVCVKA
ncbi:hypothetical protein MPH_02289 [Macrophomina phaseolina MS6]|uniref:LysM domain-containing protein n=2 Tax=Macrophomina phaseolina TaxID=35725 RepID=K2SD93_MACPH|nr:hypothetical protein MPH_02289 [Macrophomina phaseolina MS6]KAH7042001.1 hypothetical protein B0J12DRAFT_712860 [Macrophomina phaseolina]